MLKKPSLLFLNCLGSYFYSIIESINKKGQKDVLLYYLSDGQIIYNNLDIKKIKEKFGDNPWGYQPIKIESKAGEMLAINESFFKYIYDNHKIVVEKKLVDKKSDLIKELIVNHGLNYYSICTVDEYFIPNNSRFYKTSHNKHFVLIKDIHIFNKTIEVIDSEKNYIYTLKFCDLEQAVYNSTFTNNYLYRINCIFYEDKIDRKKLLFNYKICLRENTFITDFIEDIRYRLVDNDTIFSYYYLLGYYYSIISKIIPYSKMISTLLKENRNILFYDAENIVNLWKGLRNLILYKSKKKNKNYEEIVSKLNQIYIFTENLTNAILRI